MEPRIWRTDLSQKNNKICPLHHTEKDTIKIKISFLDSFYSRNAPLWPSIHQKRTAMHYRAISSINLPKTYDDAILAEFVVNHATDSNRTVRVEWLRCHYTCQIFKCRFAVGQLSVNCWYTAGRQLANRLLGELFFTFTLHGLRRQKNNNDDCYYYQEILTVNFLPTRNSKT